MKKLLLIFISLLLIVGCSSKEDKLDKASLERYESYWEAIKNQENYRSDSDNFSIEAILSGDEYSIVVDEPRRAMYDVQIMAIENEDDFNLDIMMPTIGVLDKETYNLIPNQSNKENLFLEWFLLSGEVDSLPLKVEVMVLWKNYNRTEETREYFEFVLDDAVTEE